MRPFAGNGPSIRGTRTSRSRSPRVICRSLEPQPKEEQYRWYVGEKEEYLDQVGCIYTAQGLEFDDTGVILVGRPVLGDDLHDWHIDLSSNCDATFMAAIQKSSQPSKQEIVELVLNTYRVLLTRAKSSVHIWFRDPVTRDHVRKVLDF